MSNKLMGYDGYMTLAADGYSDPIAMGKAKNLAMQCDVSTSSTIDGYMSLQFSNNRENWVSDDGVRVQAAGSLLLELADSGVGYVRVKWNHDSGEGSASLYANRK